MDSCKKCHIPLSTDYCPQCGLPRKPKRIDAHYVVSEIASVFNFQKGISYTIKELIIRPGENVRIYLTEDRNRLVKPITFILITSLIYSLLLSFLQFEDGYIDYRDDQESITLAIFAWIQANYGYANIMMALFIGLWLKVFFLKRAYNLFEILVLLCFAMGIGMLIYALFGTINSLTSFDTMGIGVMVGFIYTTYAIGQFFNPKSFLSYLKALLAYVLGMLTFTLAALGIGFILDWMI